MKSEASLFILLFVLPFGFLCAFGSGTFLVKTPSHVSDLTVDEKTVLTDNGESRLITSHLLSKSDEIESIELKLTSRTKQTSLNDGAKKPDAVTVETVDKNL